MSSHSAIAAAVVHPAVERFIVSDPASPGYAAKFYFGDEEKEVEWVETTPLVTFRVDHSPLLTWEWSIGIDEFGQLISSPDPGAGVPQMHLGTCKQERSPDEFERCFYQAVVRNFPAIGGIGTHYQLSSRIPLNVFRETLWDALNTYGWHDLDNSLDTADEDTKRQALESYLEKRDI